MKADTLSVSGVIQKNTLLRIPYFQRRYVWGEEDWERFAIDMESTLDSDRYYFLGAIILKEESVTTLDKKNGIGKRQLVIDGQQRLTTMAIYMKLLHMMTGKNDEFANQYLQATDVKDPVIIHNCDDMPLFSQIMHLDTPVEIKGNSNIVNAYNFFLKYLEDRKKKGVKLNELLNTVNSGVNFVVITLSKEDDEQQIFDTINSLGVPLTTDELMKNFLYEANDEEAYKQNWKEIFDTDEARKFWESDASYSRQAKSNKNTTIGRFFHAFVRIKMWDFKDKLTESQRRNFVKTENVFTTCKAFVEIFGMNKQDLANEIIEYAKLFKQYLSDAILDTRIPLQAGIKRLSCFINATKTVSAIPYVLYILHNVQDEAERNRVFGYLEIYLVRRIICKSSNKNYSDLFSENLIGGRANTYSSLKAYIEGRPKGSSLIMPTNSNIVFAVNNNKIDEATARIVLYLFETRLSKIADKTFMESYNSCMAEQLMPRSCAAADVNWAINPEKDEEEYRQQLIGTLGNYFLLRGDDNEKAIKKAHNDALIPKLKNMRRWSKNIRCSQILSTKLPKWDEKSITLRDNKLAEAINILWN